MDKDIRKLIKQATRQGWTVEVTSKVTFMAPNPSHGSVTAHLTNSDWRALKNLTSELKKRGFRAV